MNRKEESEENVSWPKKELKNIERTNENGWTIKVPSAIFHGFGGAAYRYKEKNAHFFLCCK